MDFAVTAGFSSGASSRFESGDFPYAVPCPLIPSADDDLLDGEGRGGVAAPAFFREFIEALRSNVGDAVRVSRLIALGLLRRGL